MAPAIRFATERLNVSPWDELLDDAKARPGFVAELARMLTPEVTRHLPPVWQISETPQDMDGWIAARRAASAIACVNVRTNGNLAGLLVTRPASDDDTLIVGYLFSNDYWGRGYATELVRGVIGWAAANGYMRLEAGVVRENAASAAVLVKTGFARAGLTDDGVDAYRLDIDAGSG